MTVRVLTGDCRAVLAALHAEGARFDACVTDPPYHLASIVKRFGAEGAAPPKSDGPTGVYKRAAAGFMGKKWDGGDVAFDPATWRRVYDVLKPGAHLLAFGAPRNFGFLQVAVAEAGFEIRDTVLWLFGSGFPKSHNLDGAWEGWGTALKPAAEFVTLARKPLVGTVAVNVEAHGTGALNIDGCRVAAPDGVPTRSRFRNPPGVVRTSYDLGTSKRTGEISVAGRWPANVAHDGSEEVLAAFPQTAPSPESKPRPPDGPAQSTWSLGRTGGVIAGHNDSGSAARFFYCAKAGADDRLGSKHPTVKPVDLMRWLVRLVTPPGGHVLDPFAGTGTTGAACIREGFDATLVEREADSVADIERRLAHMSGADTPLLRLDRSIAEGGPARRSLGEGGEADA
jgi:site-specific DNA-methyltransferase (adenine-specific)